MKNKIWNYFLFPTFLLCSCLYACEREDETANNNKHLSRFFDASDASTHLQKVVCSLKQKNDSSDFASEFTETYGYPLWREAVAFFEGECFTYAVPIKNRLPNSEINAIWFFIMNDSCTNYHVYSREMADAITRQVGDETEQTWMFDYFTCYALHKEPASGLRFVITPLTRTTQVAMECENTVRVEGTTIEIDVHCWNSGGGGGTNNRGDIDLSGSGSVEEPRPSFGNGGGGGGNSSGSSTTSSTAPTASKLFKSTLSKSDWQALELRVHKIMIDCMGGTLYNSLVHSGKIQIRITSEASSYNPATKTINLNKDMESNQLFHEMWHAYQSSRMDVSDYNNSTINSEIEAHYAQYLYLKKLKEYKGSKWEKNWTKHPRLYTIKKLERYVDSKGHLLSKVNTELLDFTLNQIASMFETHEYTDGNVYKYNWDIKGLDNFKNLRELAKDC